VVVYSPLGDALARGALNGLPDSQVAQVSFQSASASITLAPRAGTLTVRAPQDPRYGQSISTVDASQPGRLVVEFQSSDSSFNSVPGTVVAISATMAADAPAGTVSPFAFDREGTWLLDPKGNRIALALGDGMLQIQ
jgi:hypothetical protein